MLNSSVEPFSDDVNRVRSHFLVTILTLILSILVFIPVYLVVRQDLSLEQDLVYLLLLIVSIIAFNLFFAVLRLHHTWQVVPYLLMFIIFIVGYHLKFWQIAMVGEDLVEEWQLDVVGFSTSLLLETFEIITVGFVTFCFAAIFYMLLRPRWEKKSAQSQDPHLTEAWGILTQRLAIILPVVSILVLLLLERYDIGIRGVHSVRLPFRLTGIIFYFSVVVLPALQLVFIHAARQSRRLNPLGYPLFLLIIYSFITTIIFASRGNLLYGMLAAFFLIATYPEYRRRSVVILLAAVVITSLLFTLITDFRYLLVLAQGSTLLAMEALFDYNITQEGNVLFNGSSLVFSRIIGANSLLVIASRMTEPLGISYALREGLDLGGYYTNVMLGISEQRTHRAAPSLFGWFYLAGGTWALWLGMLAFTISTGAIWDILHKLEDSGWLAIPVIQSLFLVNLIQVSSDGGLHRSFTMILAILGAMVLTRIITRRMHQHRTKLDAVQN